MSKIVTPNTRQSKAKLTLSTSMLVSPGKADNAQAKDSQASSSQASTQRPFITTTNVGPGASISRQSHHRRENVYVA